jgi:Family of unknown function (DUF6049)
MLACLLAGIGVVSTTALTGPPATAAEGTRTPLKVSVETLAPATVPTTGRVTLTGRVTNRSNEVWTDVRAYMFTSSTPITDQTGLAEADATDEADSVGSRLTDPGLYDAVGDLAPGQTKAYRVSVPRARLGIGPQPGVYWIGVHVLGGSQSTGRDTIADGRARTFIPQLPRRTPSTRLALVVPVKAEVRRGAAGRLLGFGAWGRSLGPDGRLDRLLNLSGRTTAPITWVVDPAVLDAARSVSQDNPKIDPGPDGSADGASGSPSPSASSSASPSDGSSDGTGTGDVGAASEPSAQAVAARAWLEEFGRQAPTHTVTTVPYGDLDVASVLSTRLDDLYQQARTLSAETMAAHGVDASGVVDPTDGRLPAKALRAIDQDTPVLLRDQAFPEAQRPVLTRRGRAPVVLTDTVAGSGGPRPNARYAALAMRQRLLAESALHALSAERDQPLVVSTPPYWDPGSTWSDADFFAGLQQPWLRLVDLPSIVSGAGAAPGGDPSGETTPVYTRTDRKAQLPLANLLATERLGATATTFDRLLPDNETVRGELARIGMLSSSQSARRDPDRTLSQVNSTTDYVRAQMQSVRIEGPSFVMMSGEDGPIQVTLVNGLDQRVRVGIAAQTRSAGLKIRPHDDVTLGPGRRTAIRLQASSRDIGVHAVTLVVTDSEGNPLGSLTQVSVRTSRVSTVIWVIMAVGGVLLFLAIGVRLFRRVRRRKSTHGPRLPRDKRRLPGQELNA